MAHKQGTAGEAYIGWMVCGWGEKSVPAIKTRKLQVFRKTRPSAVKKHLWLHFFQILFEARK